MAESERVVPGSLPSEVAALSFEEFHRKWLAERIASGHGDALAQSMRRLQPLTLCIESGMSFTYSSTSDNLAVAAGDDGETVIEFDRASFRDFADERTSAAALVYSGRATVLRGGGHQFILWEPVLRALYHDRRMLRLSELDPRDRTGAPLDTSRSFAMEELGEEFLHFLRTAGFVVVRGVYSANEVAELRAECERARAAMTRDDPRAWWGEHSDGSMVCARVNYAGDFSNALQALFTEPRLRAIIAATGEPVRPAADRLDGATVIFKTPEMRRGLSDLPWHRDCGMGGHPVMCPLINASVHLTQVSAATGDLRAIPGSFAGSIAEIDGAMSENAGISLAARAGDVTLHYGDVLHCAPPPTDRSRRTGRITINLTHPHERCFEYVGPRQGYTDVLIKPRN